MMVMTDLEEPFVPLSEGLFVDPYESKYAFPSACHCVVSGRDKSLLNQNAGL